MTTSNLVVFHCYHEMKYTGVILQESELEITDL